MTTPVVKTYLITVKPKQMGANDYPAQLEIDAQNKKTAWNAYGIARTVIWTTPPRQ